MPTSSYMPDVKVEIAFNAGYLDPAASRTWTDVSAYAELGESITITGGRSDERSTADANHLTLTLDNRDGRFTVGKTTGAYYPNVKLFRPIRVKATPVDGAETTRFLGFILEWPTEWDGTDAYAKATISATSRLSRLGSTTALTNIVSQAILAEGPAAYYTLGEPAGATQANDSSGNRRAPLPLAGNAALPVVFGSATGPGTDSLTAVEFAGGQYLSGYGTFLNTGALTVSCFWSSVAPPAFNTGILEVIESSSGTGPLLTVETTGIVRAATQGAGSLVVGASTVASAANLCDGYTHHLALVHDGATSITLYVDGVSQGTTTHAANAQTWTSLDSMSVGTSNFGTFSLSGVVAHLALFADDLTATQVDSISDAGLTGYAGETTSARLLRYAGYAGVESVAIAAETGQTTVQHIDTTDKNVLELMRTMETTEGGVLFDGRGGSTVFHNRAHRLTAASAFTLDMAQQMVEADYRPKVDASAVANDITATDVSGQYSAHVFDATSKTDNGVVNLSIETASQDDDEPLFQASWALYKFKDPRERVPSLTVNALAQVGKTPNCTAVMAVTVGDEITVSNRPTQASSSSVDYFIEGWTEVYVPESLFITWNLSPSSPDDLAFMVGSATRGIVGTNPIAL